MRKGALISILCVLVSMSAVMAVDEPCDGAAMHVCVVTDIPGATCVDAVDANNLPLCSGVKDTASGDWWDLRVTARPPGQVPSFILRIQGTHWNPLPNACQDDQPCHNCATSYKSCMDCTSKKFLCDITATCDGYGDDNSQAFGDSDGLCKPLGGMAKASCIKDFDARGCWNHCNSTGCS